MTTDVRMQERRCDGANMRPSTCGLIAIGLIAMQSVALAQSADATRSPNTLQELFDYFYHCARTPPGPEGSEVTLRFSLTHFGALRGKPMITYSRLTGSTDEQRLFLSAALDAVERCLPVPLTEQFGKIVAQKMIVMRFPRPRDRGA